MSLKLSPGDLVRAKSGGPIMMVEADRGNGSFTFTWFEKDEARSILLPADLVVPMLPETPKDEITDVREVLAAGIQFGGEENLSTLRMIRFSEIPKLEQVNPSPIQPPNPCVPEKTKPR